MVIIKMSHFSASTVLEKSPLHNSWKICVVGDLSEDKKI